MAEDLEALWARLSLTENEKVEVVLGEDSFEDSLLAGHFCLIGKAFTHKVVNLEAMRTVFQKVWKVRSGLQVSEVGDKIFAFIFEDIKKKNWVLLNQPWSFNKFLIVFRDFDGFSSPESTSFVSCPFWVQIHGLPLALMNDRVVHSIVQSMGHIIDPDFGDSSVRWARFARVKVDLDISTPLLRGKEVMLNGRDKIVVMFKYEKLPEFCYIYGRLDHQENNCATGISMKMNTGQCVRQYGKWLRADGPKSPGDRFDAISLSVSASRLNISNMGKENLYKNLSSRSSSSASVDALSEMREVSVIRLALKEVDQNQEMGCKSAANTVLSPLLQKKLLFMEDPHQRPLVPSPSSTGTTLETNTVSNFEGGTAGAGDRHEFFGACGAATISDPIQIGHLHGSALRGSFSLGSNSQKIRRMTKRHNSWKRLARVQGKSVVTANRSGCRG
ncbi:hypothetical protein REPUB_Repub13aG0147300 [Reevesia pubescens]